MFTGLAWILLLKNATRTTGEFIVMHITRFIAVLTLAWAGWVSATPIETTTFYFSGLCDDCAGDGPLAIGANVGDGIFQTVTGKLVLQDFVAGALLREQNFVSFTYNGSSLLDPFTVVQPYLFYTALNADGSLTPQSYLVLFDLQWETPDLGINGSPSSIDCGIVNQRCSFSIGSPSYNSSWRIGQTFDGDIGIDGRFSVPTPATLALFSLGLAGLGWSRRNKA